MAFVPAITCLESLILGYLHKEDGPAYDIFTGETQAEPSIPTQRRCSPGKRACGGALEHAWTHIHRTLTDGHAGGLGLETVIRLHSTRRGP